MGDDGLSLRVSMVQATAEDKATTDNRNTHIC